MSRRCLGRWQMAAAAYRSQVPGLRRQVPGSGIQHQVQVRARALFGCLSRLRLFTLCPALVPEPDNPFLIPDQPRPDTRSAET